MKNLEDEYLEALKTMSQEKIDWINA